MRNSCRAAGDADPRALARPLSLALAQRQQRPGRVRPDALDQAARTDSRNLVTSSLSRLLSRDSDLAEAWTWADAAPVSPAPRCTSVMLAETSVVPCAAFWMLREISCVAAPCSSTAAAM